MKVKKARFWVCTMLLLILVMGNVMTTNAASTHTHEMGSYAQVERVLWEEVLYHYYYTGENGRTYDYQTVSQYCLWYYTCYCGYRGNYFERGRIIYRDVIVPQ